MGNCNEMVSKKEKTPLITVSSLFFHFIRSIRLYENYFVLAVFIGDHSLYTFSPFTI